MCLICGYVGCGRYVNEHARLHYKESLHTYAMELQTSRVWDYSGDKYVHRLVQSKADDKLVAFNTPQSQPADSPHDDTEMVCLSLSD